MDDAPEDDAVDDDLEDEAVEDDPEDEAVDDDSEDEAVELVEDASPSLAFIFLFTHPLPFCHTYGH